MKKGSSLLITGGGSLSDRLVKMGIDMGVPVIQSPYETFVAISMINKAIYERLIQQDLARVGDIMKRQIDCMYPTIIGNKHINLARYANSFGLKAMQDALTDYRTDQRTLESKNIKCDINSCLHISSSLH